MSKFSKKHYEVVADVIKNTITINPLFSEDDGDHLTPGQSIINGFIIAFKADNNEFNQFKFEQAIKS